MAKIHMILQGKGGVGKSFISALLAQYKASKGHKSLCIGTDPVNAIFHGYQALGVRQIPLMDGDEINPRRFDTLVEMIAPSEQDVIIDNGASAFVPLTHYLISNQVPALLAGMGHELVLHTVVTGGQALLDTVNGFASWPTISRWKPCSSSGSTRTGVRSSTRGSLSKKPRPTAIASPGSLRSFTCPR
jgi:hypothetical protein